MSKLLSLCLVMLGLYSGLVYSETTKSSNTIGENVAVITEQPLGRYPRWKALVDEEDKLWLAYYRADEKLVIHRPDNSEIILNPIDRPNAFSGLAITPSSDGLSVMWRDKLPTKTLYFLPDITLKKETSEPLIIDQDTEALTRFSVVKDKGETYFLWYGEKSHPGEKKYQLYFRYLGTDGQSLSDTKMLMAGIYPAWIVDDDVIPVFSWVPEDDKRFSMAMRVFDRKTKEFGPFTKIAEAPPIGPFFFTLKSDKRWFLFWLGHYGDDGKQFLIEGVYSDDKGKGWQRFSLDSLKGFDLSDIQPAIDDSGNILLVLSGRMSGAKNDIYFLRSTDNGTTWSEPKRPRPAEFRNTKADYPSVAFGSKPGTAMMVWEDWRNIRANVYASYSTDSGATWSDPAPLASQGPANLTLSFDSENLFKGKNENYYLIARQFTDDALINSKLVKYTLTSSWLQSLQDIEKNKMQTSKATEARLRERVDSYWNAMKNDDYDTSYSLLDPFFRARRPFKNYRMVMGKVGYYDFTIESIEKQGNIAKVKVVGEASVHEMKLPSGEMYSAPKKKISFTETWVFVDDDWYREYFEEMAGVRYTRY